MRRFKNILFVADSKLKGGDALERAVSLAKNNRANLTVIDVVESVSAGIGMMDGGQISAKLKAAVVGAHAQELETWVDPFRKRVQIQTKILTGMPFLEIIYEVLRNGHDLVIRIPETLDWLNRLFGSDDMHLLRKCPCPVWLIKPQAPKSYRCILAAVDVGGAYPPVELESRRALNLQILEMASSLALSDFAELHIVHAWHTVSESTMLGALIDTPEDEIIAYVEEVKQRYADCLDGLMREVTSNLGQDAVEYLKPQTHLLKGLASEKIPALAKRIDADLVVMGTVARIGIPGLFMSNMAETILNRIDCSVLAIKPEGFVTPVTLEE